MNTDTKRALTSVFIRVYLWHFAFFPFQWHGAFRRSISQRFPFAFSSFRVSRGQRFVIQRNESALILRNLCNSRLLKSFDFFDACAYPDYVPLWACREWNSTSPDPFPLTGSDHAAHAVSSDFCGARGR